MLFDLFFPKTCLVCGYLGSYICLSCEKKLVWFTKYRFAPYSEKNFIPRIGLTLSALKYTGVTKQIIKKLKYRFLFDAFQEFFQVITPHVIEKFSFYKTVHPDAYLQPIPLHPQREKWRGFNQSQIIAQYFHKIYGYPIISCLERIKYTQPQASEKSREARKKNMQGSFTIKGQLDIKEKNIILVDDVITTGYTIEEAARVLKMRGAATVSAFSVARGL